MDGLDLRPRRPPRPGGGQLAKALLVDTTTGVSHAVMYNPEELTLEQGNTFAEIGIPGLNASPTQYVRGKARALTMELFFDTYESGQDVRAHTAPIVALLDKQPQSQAPPVLLFSMGRLQFRCVLVDAGQRFTMFLRDGTPVRSTLSVRLQEYIEVELEIRQGLLIGSPTVSGAVTAAATAVRSTLQQAGTVHTAVEGDTLSGLAGIYLGDPARWREIARANGIEDPLHLPPGLSLVIPSAGAHRPAAPGGGRP